MRHVRPIPSAPTLPAYAALAGVIALALAGAGCGRRATHGDCQLIVDKSVELQLKELSTSPEEIAKREAQIRTELEGEIKSCEGRRVTDKTMSCVAAAVTTEELDKCLR